MGVELPGEGVGAVDQVISGRPVPPLVQGDPVDGEELLSLMEEPVRRCVGLYLTDLQGGGLLRVQAERLVQRVNLNLALGGRFDEQPAAPQAADENRALASSSAGAAR